MGRKVCILTTVHPPFDTRIFHKQAKTLVKAKYDVTLIAQHNKNEVVDGVKIVALPKPRNRFARIFGLTWKAFLLALHQRADIYHFHDPELLGIGLLLKLFTRARVIYDVHENVRKQILNKSWLPLRSRKLLSLVYALIESIFMRFLDGIVIAEDSYLENYRGRMNIVAVRNYPIVSSLPICPSISVKRAQEGDPRFVVTYVGGITRLRGVVQMVEALRILQTAKLLQVMLNLVGPVIPASLESELDSLIQQYDLEENVFTPGLAPHEEVFEILYKSHVGIAVLHPDPNYIESLPTKLFEYMATGLPVIASNFPLWKEIVEGNRCGSTVNPLDPEEIARAIEYLINHPDEARRMGENGRRAVLEKYNWENESKKLLKLYEGLLEK